MNAKTRRGYRARKRPFFGTERRPMTVSLVRFEA